MKTILTEFFEQAAFEDKVDYHGAREHVRTIFENVNQDSKFSYFEAMNWFESLGVLKHAEVLAKRRYK